MPDARVQTEALARDLLEGEFEAKRARRLAAFYSDRLERSGLIAGQGPNAAALSEIAIGCRAAYEFPEQRFRLHGDMARILCDHLAPERAGQYIRPPSPGAEFDAYLRGGA